jgi:hypothetical protein
MHFTYFDQRQLHYLEALSLERCRGTSKFAPLRLGESFSEFISASPSDFAHNFSLLFLASCGPYGSPLLIGSCSTLGFLSDDWLNANVARLVIVKGVVLRCESGLAGVKSDNVLSFSLLVS